MSILLISVLAAQPPLPTNPFKIVFGSAISIYQNTLSPLQGGVCNFSPSCSRFGKQAIEKYGAFWGTLMAADRLMRCNPWAPSYFGRFYREIRNNHIYDPIENNYIFRSLSRPDDSTEIH
jgi:putative membrane protein insertion efficiency factor